MRGSCYLFNHPIFRFPKVVKIGRPSTFTRITETAIPARLIQFGMKYSFQRFVAENLKIC